MAAQAPNLPHLFGAHLGNRVARGNEMLRMAEMIGQAPQLQPGRLDQVAALPLGSRLKVDSWSGQVELLKGKPTAPMTAREKMPFLVTPLYPHISRQKAVITPPAAGSLKATTDHTPELE